MKPIYLSVYAHVGSTPEVPETLRKLPLWRRMTALQKSVLLCFERIASHSSERLHALRESRAPLYFASAYGEVSSMLRLTQSIAEGALPVSPKDFQHSVLNAAVAYLAMQQGSQQPGFALSGGFASVDKVLELAARRLDFGFEEEALLIHAHESVGEVDEATTEILLLSTRADGATHVLTTLASGFREPGFVCDHDESLEAGTIPWFLSPKGPSLSRRVRTLDGRVHESHWRALS